MTVHYPTGVGRAVGLSAGKQPRNLHCPRSTCLCCYYFTGLRLLEGDSAEPRWLPARAWAQYRKSEGGGGGSGTSFSSAAR